jgi:hypothetical protein
MTGKAIRAFYFDAIFKNSDLHVGCDAVIAMQDRVRNDFVPRVHNRLKPCGPSLWIASSGPL